MTSRTLLLTCVAMLSFAANSLLCRLALAPDLIDPASFTSVRVASACAMLILVVWLKSRRLPRLQDAKVRSIAALFGYIVFFSFAYVRLDAGTGALILFGAVQLTMFAIALREGEPFPPLAWLGLAIAIAGLVWLMLPGTTARLSLKTPAAGSSEREPRRVIVPLVASATSGRRKRARLDGIGVAIRSRSVLRHVGARARAVPPPGHRRGASRCQ